MATTTAHAGACCGKISFNIYLEDARKACCASANIQGAWPSVLSHIMRKTLNLQPSTLNLLAAFRTADGKRQKECSTKTPSKPQTPGPSKKEPYIMSYNGIP